MGIQTKVRHVSWALDALWNKARGDFFLSEGTLLLEKPAMTGFVVAVGLIFLVAAPAVAHDTSENRVATAGVAEDATEAAGATGGAVIDPPPPRVVDFVVAQPLPSHSLVIQERIAIGVPVPDTVFLTVVPADKRYGFALVNDKRVIADVGTRTVVELVDK
ncbi:DUF1236 domain-containing protein [Sinorhizobium sp. 8-89]|uniref:DUF1236 domain-containing protein n=1 Tax=Sinorhizobium sp. 7-81 TaxID=3049087 RepID=UPI0024C41261|nr:DUF1236 domain-containing protein [Sinorhizobium sp. 7-81]MDK1389683.1 DUF1236 domain-containing protein [Sinorhizobium sp. 7-81]